MRRQKFKVTLISSKWSNWSQFALTHNQWWCRLQTDQTVSRYNFSTMLIDFNVQILNTWQKNILPLNFTLQNFDSEWRYPWIHRKWRHTTDVSWLDGSHHMTSTRAIIRCNIISFKNNDNIKPVPKLAKRFAVSLQSWKRRATVKSSQYNIHAAQIMFSFAYVIIKTDRIKWT